MMRALWTAATGMVTQQSHMDVIANNLANVNTTGAKKQRAEFQDLMYQSVREAGATSGADTQYPTAIQMGSGARLSATTRVFTQGNFETTGDPSNLAIEGEGFFQVTMPDGTLSYTRDGSFKLDSNRRMVTTDGYPIEPEIIIPENAASDSIVIAADGQVSVTIDKESQDVGQLTLARFVNPAGLKAEGKNMFTVTNASGEAIVSNPTEDGAGAIAQKTLEMSNVQIVEEMVNMIIAQRAYETNSKAITTSDSMLEVANGLKR